MSRLIERTVQDEALVYLKKRYQKWASGNRMYARIEVRTKKEFGGKRADGFLAFKHYIWGTFVVSMEAKSFKTLPAMKPYRDDSLLIKHCIIVGLTVCVLSGGFFAFFKMDDGLWQYLYPLNATVISALLYGYFTRNSYRHQLIDVVQQLEQYPGNHQWLAFSKDSIKDIPKKKWQTLEKICMYRGIGVLIVSNKGEIELFLNPTRRWKWFGDYVRFYSKEKEIRTTISKKK